MHFIRLYRSPAHFASVLQTISQPTKPPNSPACMVDQEARKVLPRDRLNACTDPQHPGKGFHTIPRLRHWWIGAAEPLHPLPPHALIPLLHSLAGQPLK